MKEEEKKAVEFIKDLISWEVGIDMYTNKEECKKLETILNLIEKLQKENEELKKYKEYYSSAKQLVDNNYIHKQKVKDKIEELIEDEINIDSIEELNDTCYDVNTMSDDDLEFYHNKTRATINEILQSVKQIDKRVKKLEKE